MKQILTAFTLLVTLAGCVAEPTAEPIPDPIAEPTADQAVFYLRWAGDRFQGVVADPVGDRPHRVIVDDLGGHRGMGQFRPELTISVDGRQLAAKIWRGLERTELRVFDLATGASRAVVALPGWANKPEPVAVPEPYNRFNGNRAMLGDGGFIYAEDGALVEHAADGAALERIECGGMCLEPDATADGQRIVYVLVNPDTRKRTLAVVSRTGAPRLLTAPRDHLTMPRWMRFDWQ